MKYSVNWSPDACRQLAAIWVHQVLDRRNITTAQAQIDRLLSSDPLGNGAVLSEGLYGIGVQPLRVVYEVSEKDQVVVVSVKSYP